MSWLPKQALAYPPAVKPLVKQADRGGGSLPGCRREEEGGESRRRRRRCVWDGEEGWRGGMMV